MPGREHIDITRTAVNSLPSWQKKILGEKGRGLIIEDCTMPDRYFDIKGGGYEKSLPYALLIDNIQFHYIPNTPIEGEYRFWNVVKDRNGRPLRLERVMDEGNINWKHASKGFLYYIDSAVKSLREDKIEDFAGFAGVLLHTLQDAGVGNHALEGVDGTDIFVLDRLIKPPADRPLFIPSVVLSTLNIPEIPVCRPSLLGTSVKETAFLLYTEYYNMVSSARIKLIPIVLSTYASNKEETDRLYSEMLYRCARLCTSVLYTVICIASGKLSQRESAALKKIYLSDLKPIREPRILSLPYRFLRMLKDAALNENQKAVPLELLVGENGKKRRKVFKKGLGTGCHYEYVLSYELPAGIYKKFMCYAGLHSRLGMGGNAFIIVKFRGRKKFSERFNERKPSAKIEVSVFKGGLLELVVRCDRGMTGIKNNIVWGDPVFIKDE
jgi:hypothetical protein